MGSYVPISRLPQDLIPFQVDNGEHANLVCLDSVENPIGKSAQNGSLISRCTTSYCSGLPAIRSNAASTSTTNSFPSPSRCRSHHFAARRTSRLALPLIRSSYFTIHGECRLSPSPRAQHCREYALVRQSLVQQPALRIRQRLTADFFRDLVPELLYQPYLLGGGQLTKSRHDTLDAHVAPSPPHLCPAMSSRRW